MKNKEIKKYLNEVKLILPINSRERRDFLKQLNQHINNSKIDNYQEIVDHFGKPNEVVASYLDNMDTEMLIKELRKKQYIKIIVLVMLIIVLSVGGFGIWKLNQLYNEFVKEQPIIVETEIEVE